MFTLIYLLSNLGSLKEKKLNVSLNAISNAKEGEEKLLLKCQKIYQKEREEMYPAISHCTVTALEIKYPELVLLTQWKAGLFNTRIRNYISF